MKNKLLAIIVCFLIFLSFIGSISSASIEKKINYDPNNRDFSHSVLGEVFFNSTDVPIKYLHQALKVVYASGWYPFYYISYLIDKNNNSYGRMSELNVVETPTIVFDGGYDKISLITNNTELWITEINESVNACGSRDVKDIDLSIDVEWQGAVNPYPEDGATGVPIEVSISCSISEMKIDVEATNNESSDYNGHIHVQVTEVESEWWNDKFGNPYTFEFKDYAFNDDVEIDAGETWNETIFWDGCDYNDGDDPPRYFDHIKQDNTMVFAVAMNKNLNKWVDETECVLAGVNTDPKRFDIYFGDSFPPPKVISNGSVLKYNPPGNLEFCTTYYWRVDVWNNQSELIVGPIWSFKTRGNSPPNEPIPIYPPDGAEYLPICFYLEWNCSDPDGDDLTYDIYVGDTSPPPLIENNWTGTYYDFSPIGTLEFNTTYYWRIVVWDPYGLNTAGDIWEFRTEINFPPNQATNPRPPNNSNCVPVNATLCWNGSDPNACETMYYDVYFGLYDPPSLVSYKQTKQCYDPYGEDDMQMYETYYWKIGTWDKSGEYNESPVWIFKTGFPCAPEPPEIDGPNRGSPSVIYNFTFVSTDLCNRSFIYEIHWGDGKSETSGPHESEEVVTLSHSWDKKDEYIIMARVINEYGEKSDWSTYEINIPRNRASFYLWFEWLLEHFPMLERLLNLL